MQSGLGSKTIATGAANAADPIAAPGSPAPGAPVLPNVRTTDRLIGQSTRSSVRGRDLDDEDERIEVDIGGDAASAMSAESPLDMAGFAPLRVTPRRRQRSAAAGALDGDEEERETSVTTAPAPAPDTAVAPDIAATAITAAWPATTHAITGDASSRQSPLTAGALGATTTSTRISGAQLLSAVRRLRDRVPTWSKSAGWPSTGRLIAIGIVVVLASIALSLLSGPSASRGPATTDDKQRATDKQR